LSWLSALQASYPVSIQSDFRVNRITTQLEAYLVEVNSNAALLFQYLQVEHQFDEWLRDVFDANGTPVVVISLSQRPKLYARPQQVEKTFVNGEQRRK